MDTIPAEVRERVARGAAFMDEVDPGWWELIELDRLDLANGSRCVLGQWAEANLPGWTSQFTGETYDGDFEDAVTDLDLTTDEVADAGFATCTGYENYSHLNEAWTDEILYREMVEVS